MTAEYGLNANKSNIESNLKKRFKNSFNKKNLEEFFAEMDSLASKGQDKYWISEIRNNIKEYFDENYSSDFKRIIFENILHSSQNIKIFVKCFINTSKLLSSRYWKEGDSTYNAYNIYSLALSNFSSIIDKQAPSINELIELGLINSLYWISSGKTKKSDIEYWIPIYLSENFDEIDNRIKFPDVSVNVKEFLKLMIHDKEFEQLQLIDSLLNENNCGYLPNYENIISYNGIIGKGLFHVSINPIIIDDLRGELTKWKEKILNDPKKTLEILINHFRKKYKVKFGTGWQKNLRRIEFFESPEVLFEINTWITRPFLSWAKSIIRNNQVLVIIIQKQSISSLKRLISQENFNLGYLILFLEENKIISDKINNLKMIPKILNELIEEWNKIFDIRGENTLETFGDTVEDKHEFGIQHEGKELEMKQEIFIGCAGYWELNKFHFKVKIKNDTKYVITNVRIILDRFPSMLEFLDEPVKTIQRLEPNGGIWTPEFILNAGNECISGIISSSVKYYDYMAKKKSREVRDYEISYICPLLEAKNISEIEYLRITREMDFQEGRIELDGTQDILNLLAELQEKLSNMNLSIINLQGKPNEIVGYAEDKLNHDGLALEVKIENIEGKLEVILKALCEHDNKCAPLLHKAVQEISKIGISIEKEEIMKKLELFIDKPNDLRRYLKKIMKSDWSDDKKDKWAQVVLEILEDWKSLKSPNYKRIVGSLLLSISSKIVGEELTDMMTEGIQKIFEKISE